MPGIVRNCREWWGIAGNGGALPGMVGHGKHAYGVHLRTMNGFYAGNRLDNNYFARLNRRLCIFWCCSNPNQPENNEIFEFFRQKHCKNEKSIHRARCTKPKHVHKIFTKIPHGQMPIQGSRVHGGARRNQQQQQPHQLYHMRPGRKKIR